MPPNPHNDDSDETVIHPVFLALVDRFDQMLAVGDTPKIVDFLNELQASNPDDTLRRAFLLELTVHQQFHDWMRKGKREPWEHYISGWAELRAWPEAERKLRKQQQEFEERLVVESPVTQQAPTTRAAKQEWETRFDIIKRQIGQGGFGKVHLGKDPHTKRQVAIKVVDEAEIESKYAPQKAKQKVVEAKRFLQNEVNKLKSLFHPNIIRLLEIGFPPEPGQEWYLVYEYIDGGTLTKRLDGGCPLDLTLAVTIAMKVARALHHAHRHEGKIIHRDIKPDNILLDSQNEPFLIDFGLATTKLDVQRGAGFGGTKRYLSPEQIEGNPDRISYRTDIYSLGVVLYEMVTGKWPFVIANKSDAAIFKAIRDQDWTSLWIANPNAPQNRRVQKQLDAICKKAMQGLPSLRFENADDMADELEEVLELLKQDQPPFVPPPVVVPVTEPEKAETVDVVPEDIVQPVSEIVTDEDEQAQDAAEPAIDEDPPVREPPQDEKSKPSRLRRLIGLVACLSIVVAGVAFMLLQPPLITKSVLANEFSTKNIRIYPTKAETADAWRLAWPITERDGRKWYVAPTESGSGSQLLDGDFLPVKWSGFTFAENESDLIKLPLLSPIFWNLERCDPSGLRQGAQLVLLNQGVFNQRNEQHPSENCLSEIRVLNSPRSAGDGNLLIELDRGVADIAIGSPVFAGTTETRLARLLDEHVRRKKLGPEFHLAGIVVNFDNTSSVGTTLVLKPINVLEKQVAGWSVSPPIPPIAPIPHTAPLQLTDIKPAIGTALVVGKTKTVRLTFDRDIKVGSAPNSVTADNAGVEVREVVEAGSRSVQLDVTPTSLGSVVIHLPAGFVSAEEIRFTAITPPESPTVLTLKWQPPVPNNKKVRPFVVTFSKPVRPIERLKDRVQDWFDLDGAAGESAIVEVKPEDWIGGRREIHGEVTVQNEGELKLNVRQAVFEDAANSNIPNLKSDVLERTFDWTPPDLLVTRLPKVVILGEMLTIRVSTEKKEQLTLNKAAISAPDESIELEPAVGHSDFEFEYHIRPKRVGQFEMSVVQGSVADLEGNASTQSGKFVTSVVPSLPRATMTQFADEAEKVFDQQPQNAQLAREQGQKLFGEISKAFEMPDSSNAPWEANGLMAAVALDIAKSAHELAAKAAMSSDSDRFHRLAKEAFTYNRLALLHLRLCKPEPKQVREQTLVELLSVRCQIDQAVLLKRRPELIKDLPMEEIRNRTGSEYALTILDEAEAMLNESHGRYPNFDAYIDDYLKKRVNDVRDFVKKGTAAPERESHGPAIWIILNESYKRYWPDASK